MSKTKFTRIKQNSIITYQWRGLMYRAKYMRRYKSISGQWWYVMSTSDGRIEKLACEVLPIFYGAEGRKRGAK